MMGHIHYTRGGTIIACFSHTSTTGQFLSSGTHEFKTTPPMAPKLAVNPLKLLVPFRVRQKSATAPSYEEFVRETCDENKDRQGILTPSSINESWIHFSSEHYSQDLKRLKAEMTSTKGKSVLQDAVAEARRRARQSRSPERAKTSLRLPSTWKPTFDKLQYANLVQRIQELNTDAVLDKETVDNAVQIYVEKSFEKPVANRNFGSTIRRLMGESQKYWDKRS